MSIAYAVTRADRPPRSMPAPFGAVVHRRLAHRHGWTMRRGRRHARRRHQRPARRRGLRHPAAPARKNDGSGGEQRGRPPQVRPSHSPPCHDRRRPEVATFAPRDKVLF